MERALRSVSLRGRSDPHRHQGQDAAWRRVPALLWELVFRAVVPTCLLWPLKLLMTNQGPEGTVRIVRVPG